MWAKKKKSQNLEKKLANKTGSPPESKRKANRGGCQAVTDQLMDWNLELNTGETVIAKFPISSRTKMFQRGQRFKIHASKRQIRQRLAWRAMWKHLCSGRRVWWWARWGSGVREEEKRLCFMLCLGVLCGCSARLEANSQTDRHVVGLDLLWLR